MTLYLWVGEPTRLTTESTRVSWVLSESDKKSTHIEICKHILTQPGPNPWWAELACGFQPILTAILSTIRFSDWSIMERMVKFNNWIRRIWCGSNNRRHYWWCGGYISRGWSCMGKRLWYGYGWVSSTIWCGYHGMVWVVGDSMGSLCVLAIVGGLGVGVDGITKGTLRKYFLLFFAILFPLSRQSGPPYDIVV